MAGEDSKSKGGIIESAVGVVPSLYYDLIARIVPGMAFCVAAAWDSNLFKFGTAIDLSILVGAGYLAGMLLTTVTYITSDVIWFLIVLIARNLDGYAELRGPWGIGMQLDKIAMTDQHSYREILKFFAEAVACENLLSGFLILLIGRCNSWPTTSILARQDVSNCLLVMVGVLLFVSAVLRSYGVSRRLLNLQEIDQARRDGVTTSTI